MTQDELFKKLVAHCKEYGFIFPSSEIYDGLGAVYDYGQNGVELKNNIKRYWWDSMVKLHENIVGIDAAIFMHPRTWEASGHVSAFNDPDIPGVACYISQAKTGGVSGSLGLAEDPSNFAISCSQVGPIEIPAKLPKQANVFRESTSVFFKATRVTRIWDAKRNTLVYLAVSRRLVDGSPFNAISTVPVKQ